MLRRLVAGMAVLMMTLSVPTAVAAEPANRPRPNFDAAIALRGTNGYHVSGIVVSAGKVGAVNLIVSRRGEAAYYTARGTGTENSIDVDLGRLGKIDFEVRPTGSDETIHEGCDGKGKAVTIPQNELVGTIDFRGEEGFTEVEKTHTPLLVKPLLQLVCGGVGFGTVFGSHVGGIEVRARMAGGPSLTIQQNHVGAPVFYEATMQEKEGTVRVSRVVGGHLGAGSLRYDPLLASASFSAPSAFSGAATYAERTPPVEAIPGHGTWRGSLKVDFPGHANVRLAGPGFKASITHAKRTESHQ